MVASGLPKRNGDKHVSEIANMALDLVESVQTFKVKHLGIYSKVKCKSAIVRFRAKSQCRCYLTS